MEYQTFATNELAGLREVLEFAVSPCWVKDVEELANGRGGVLLLLARSKGWVAKLDTGYATTALGLELIDHCKFGTGVTPTFTALQAEEIRVSVQ